MKGGQRYINLVMIPKENLEAPVLVRATTVNVAKRRLIGKIDTSPGEIYFGQLTKENHTVQLGLGPGSIHLATVWLVTDELAEALQLVEYMQLFRKDWGPNRVTVLPHTEKIVEVKGRLADLCYKYRLEENWLVDSINEEVE